MKKITFLLLLAVVFCWQSNAQITTFPYSEDFEAGAGGWVEDNTANGTWALGTPAGGIIIGAASGTNAWATNLEGDYNVNDNSTVTSPEFDFSALAGAAITVNIWWDSEFSWDGTVLQSSVDGGVTWQNVGLQGDPNWFNDDSIGGDPGGQEIGWTGSPGSLGYVTANHELNGLGGEGSVYLRFAFGSDGTVVEEGFAFDDVMITEVTCSAPALLTASNVTAATADLGWTDAVSTAWNVELVDITAGGTQTMVATASGVTNPYNATGLAELTDYEFYVQADCDSAWAGPFAFTTTAACPDPTNLGVANITTTGADLSWDQTGGVSPWNVEIVNITEGGTQTMTATAEGVLNPFSVTGLSSATDYEFYVQAACGDTWVGPFAFTTACDAFTAPYTEDFETFTTGTAAFTIENCWSGTGGNYFWESAPATDFGSGGTGPSSNITTGNYFYTESSLGAVGDITELNPPPVDLSALTAPSLGFSYHMFGGDIGTLDVVVNGNVEFTITGQQQTTELEPFETVFVDLMSYAGQTVQVVFRATSNGTFEGDIAIDNIVFDEAPSCFDPSSLTAANFTADSADLGWSANGPETLWNVEIVDVTAGENQTMVATATGVTNPYTATGLAQNNDYEFYVQADCGASGVSAWVGPIAFTTACADLTAPYTEDFETFTPDSDAFISENCWTGTGGTYFWESAAGIDTSSGGTGPSPTITTGNYFFTEASGGAVGDITELNAPPVDLSALTAPSLGFSYHMTGAQIGTLAVVVNGNVEFSLIGEQQTSDVEPFETVFVDLMAYAGQTVQVVFRATSNGTFAGDIAIDNIVFDEAPSCFDPSSLTTANITADSADLGWTANGPETLWNVEVVDVTAGGTQTMVATATGVTNPYMATGLAQNNDYEFYVQADCEDSGVSAWVGPIAFTTLETCPAPITLTNSALTDVTADFTWAMGGAETTWEYANLPSPSTEPASGTSTMALLANVTGLTAGTTYDFYVRSDCGTEFSAWTTITYTTLPAPPANDNACDAAALTLDATGTGTDYTTVGATAETAEVVGSCFNGGINASVWFTFVAPASGNVTVTTDIDADAATLDDTEIAVYSVTDCSDFTTYTEEACDQDGGDDINFNSVAVVTGLTAGDTYYVQVDRWGTQADGTFGIEVITDPGTPPANDDCASAEALTLGNMVTGNTTNATDSGVAAGACGADGADQDIWYSFVPSATGAVIVDTDADTCVIYDACDGAEVACVGTGSNDVTGLATDGLTTYYARVYNTGIAKVAGPIELTISDAALSTIDFDSASIFSYYPNPVNNTLTLNAQNEISNVAVFNMLGQEVIRTAPNAVSNELDMSNLQSGAYFVQLTVGQAIQTVRVIKN